MQGLRPIISFSGADGSGKTTLANEIARRLSGEAPDDVAIHRLWLRWNPKGRLGREPGDVESTLDVRHKGHPVKRALRGLRTGSAWTAAAERMYDYQLRLQIGAVPERHVIVADRFVPDFYADLVGSQLVSLDQIGGRMARFPAATKAYIVNVDDDVLVSRKAATEDAERLVARARLYRDLGAALGLQVINPLDPEEVDAITADIIEEAWR